MKMEKIGLRNMVMLLLVLLVAMASLALTYRELEGPGGSPTIEFIQDGTVSLNDLASGPVPVTVVGAGTLGTGSTGDPFVGCAVWANSDSSKLRVQMRGLFRDIPYDTASNALGINDQVIVNGAGKLKVAATIDSIPPGGIPGRAHVLNYSYTNATCTVWR